MLNKQQQGGCLHSETNQSSTRLPFTSSLFWFSSDHTGGRRGGGAGREKERYRKREKELKERKKERKKDYSLDWIVKTTHKYGERGIDHHSSIYPQRWFFVIVWDGRKTFLKSLSVSTRFWQEIMLVIYTFLSSDFLSGVEACPVTSTYNCAIKSHKYVEPQHWDVS